MSARRSGPVCSGMSGGATGGHPVLLRRLRLDGADEASRVGVEAG